MRKIYALIILVFFYTNCLSQSNYQDELSIKLQNAIKMKKTGKNLFVTGLIGTASGLYFTIDGIQKVELNLFDSSSDGAENEEELIIGIVILVVGEALLITGTSLWIAGGSRSNRYKKMLKKTSGGLGLGFCNEGFGIYYKF